MYFVTLGRATWVYTLRNAAVVLNKHKLSLFLEIVLLVRLNGINYLPLQVICLN
jgi:hypothetical protein